MGYPEYQKESLKPHQKQSQRVSQLLNPGLVRAHRLSASLSASPGRPRRPAKSPPRARPRMGGLDGEPILRLARGPARKASDEMPILRLARGRLSNNPSPLPRPISPIERRVQLMRPTTPAISAGRWLDTADRPTRREVASTPYRPGQDRAGVTGHCALMLCPRPTPALHYAT